MARSYKPYQVNKDPRPKIIEIGIEIATKAQIETDCHRLVPVHTRIIFGNIQRSDYSIETIHQVMKEQGYSSNQWVAKSVWQCCDDDVF